MSPVTVDKPYLFIAICLSTGVFVLGGQAWSAALIGEAVPNWHYFAHFASFAIIAVSYARALPRTSLFIVACLAVAIGGLHELYQLLTPQHDAELDDFLVNAVGAICGTLASRTLFALLQRTLRPS
jgi:VanZ family protein